MKGILLFYKPKGISSYDVIRKVKKLTGERHIGHGGTLDPLAEGLLILGIGKEAAKKLTTILKNEEKEYEATVRFGAVSETYDAEGPIKEVQNSEIKIQNLTLEKIEKTLGRFIGEIEQKPPAYSAVKIKGKPAYERARNGEKVELMPKKVFIKSIDVLDYTPPDLKIRVICGSGVYIRSLAHDLGQKLGCGAYLSDLKRTRIGNYSIYQAVTFEDVDKNSIELWAEIFGEVQGIGFRFFTVKEAKKLKLVGWVRNTKLGTVEVLAQGKEKDLREFLKKLERGPLPALVQKTETLFRKPREHFSEFSIKR